MTTIDAKFIAILAVVAVAGFAVALALAGGGDESSGRIERVENVAAPQPVPGAEPGQFDVAGLKAEPQPQASAAGTEVAGTSTSTATTPTSTDTGSSSSSSTDSGVGGPVSGPGEP